jgi:hypothetical protein
MPMEMIGEFGTPGASSEWIDAQGKLAIRHLKEICGEPPPEMELEIVWQDHELGQYPVIGLVWDDPMRGVPWNYISRCEAALAAYEKRGSFLQAGLCPPFVRMTTTWTNRSTLRLQFHLKVRTIYPNFVRVHSLQRRRAEHLAGANLELGAMPGASDLVTFELPL